MNTTDPKGIVGATRTPMHLLMRLVKPCKAIANVFALGAKNYGPFNWRKTFVVEDVYVSAIGRHMGKYLNGEEFDDDEFDDGGNLVSKGSGECHLASVIANCLILMDAKDHKTLVRYEDTGLESLQSAAELLRDIMCDKVNGQDLAEKWLRAYAPDKLEH